jgi:hypothetical protein
MTNAATPWPSCWPRSTACIDCGADPNPPWQPGAEYEWYVVHDDLWAAAGMRKQGGCLCIGCLETRLGRQLTAADFGDAPVNSLGAAWCRYAWWWRTDRLWRRLFAGIDPDEARAILASYRQAAGEIEMHH